MKSTPAKKKSINSKTSQLGTKSPARPGPKGKKAAAAKPRSEAGVTTSENNYRNILEQSSEGFALIDEKGCVIEWNQANAEITGLKRSEVLGKPYWDAAMKMTIPERRTPQNRERIKFMVLDALQSGKSPLFERPIEGELEAQPGKGKRFFHQTIFPVKSANGCQIASLTQDITERRQMEDALREGEEKWRSFVDSSPDYIAVHDRMGRYLFLNHYAKGFSEKDVIGSSLYDYLAPESRELFRRKFEECLDTRTPQKFEYRALGEERTWRMYEESLVPLTNRDNEVNVLVTARDITERKEAEDALRRSEERFRQTMDNMFEGCMIIGFDWKYLYVNEAAARHGHTERADLPGRTMMEMYPGIEQSEIFAYYRRCMEERTPQAFESSYTFSDGSINWYEMRVQPAQEGIFVLSIDITERRRADQLRKDADERFNKAFRSSPIGINIFRLADGRSLDVNDTFLTMIGYTREELLGHTAAELNLFMEPRERWIKPLRDDGKISSTETSIRTKSGEIRQALFSIESFDMNGEALGMVLCMDITERKQAEEKLRESEERYRSLFNLMEEGVAINEAVFDEKGEVIDYMILSVNPAFEKQSPYKIEQAIGKRATDIYQMSPEYIRGWWKSHSQIQGAAHTEMYHEPSGRWFHVTTTQPEEKRFATIFTDITGRKRAETKLLHINRLYATISQINQTIVRAQERDTLFSEICRVAIEHGRFRMAWVGLVDEADEHIRPIAFAGEEQGYLTNIDIAFRDPILGNGPTGTAIREGRCIICQDIATDSRMGHWREQALQRGYHSSAAVPFRQKNNPVGALTVYAAEPQGFDDDDQKLLDEIGQDISYALDSMDAENERRRAEEALREREKHSQSLLSLSRKLERSQTYAEVLHAAYEEVHSILGYNNLWVYLL